VLFRSDDAPIVGFVGQLIRRKGLTDVMQAWSALDARDFKIRPRLKIAGEGPMKLELEQWRHGLRHPQAVELLGYVEDLVTFYRTLRVLLMPSHAEGFGLAAAEAMACGVPVIAGDASSLPEIIRDGETGILVPVGNAEAVAQALERLLTDQELARKMGATGRNVICTKFPRDASLRRLLKLTGYSAQ